jgi:hypothetical protein
LAFPSAKGEVYVADKETMNGEIPLSPILGKVSSIPPVMIKSPVSEVGKLSPKVQIGVEERVESEEPKVCRWNCHVKGLN